MKRNHLTICLFVCLLIFAACARTVYVPVETIRTEYRNLERRDSIYLSDSVIIRTKADTVWFERYRFLYRDRSRTDTLLHRDTIRLPYPVVEVKEVNRLQNWQIGLMLTGAVATGWLLFSLISKIKGK